MIAGLKHYDAYSVENDRVFIIIKKNNNTSIHFN